MKTILAPGLQGPHARPAGLVLDQHPRQPRRRGARRPRELQVQGGVEARRARHDPPARGVPRAVRRASTTSCGSTTTRPAATTRRAGTTSTSSGGWATRCRSRSTSSAATRSSPRRSCSTSRCSSTSPPAPAQKGVQEWLSFYFKSPQTADPRCRPSTTSSSSRPSSRTRCGSGWARAPVTHLGTEYYES